MIYDALLRQELVAQTLRTAQLDPLNIDAVECNGQGALLRDAVEDIEHHLHVIDSYT